MTLAQDKALAQVFRDYSNKTWDRLMSNTLIEKDIILKVFEDKDISYIQGYVSKLANEFQEVFNLGYLQGVNLIKGQSVK